MPPIIVIVIIRVLVPRVLILFVKWSYTFVFVWLMFVPYLKMLISERLVVVLRVVGIGRIWFVFVSVIDTFVLIVLIVFVGW